MSRVIDFYVRLGERLGSINRLHWLVLTIGLAALYLLARQAQSPAVYEQLLALFGVDSLIFFFVDRFHAKMGLLTLIFLLIMELFVALFYVLVLYAGAVF